MAKFISLHDIVDVGQTDNDPLVQAATWLKGLIEDADRDGKGEQETVEFAEAYVNGPSLLKRLAKRQVNFILFCFLFTRGLAFLLLLKELFFHKSGREMDLHCAVFD